MTNGNPEGPERIAIVGMACRFPGAADVDAFWSNLRAGVESISTFSVDELRAAGVDPAMLAHPAFVPAFGTVEDADLFDAEFFGVNPREAELMDPQQRLFLEQAWAALEHAGCDPATFGGPIGVFAGTNLNTYLLSRLGRLSGGEALLNRVRGDKDFLSTLVSYKLDLRGPSLTVQTACSTSLVAVHLACQSLLDYQCDAALAGGVSINVPLQGGYVSGQGVLSPDGHCRAFDATGDGTVVASGVGVVVLKRLSDALADGDRIHAVILGSAINNDGAQKVGFSAPSVDGQIEVIALAHAVAGVPAESITYVEAHGTATPMGDPVEVTALTRAFDTDRRGYCALGSVKTNIGHTDAAAGVAGLIKATLALRHGEIPPSLHFEQPNPRIDFANSPFYVADRLLPWGDAEGPRRAGVSAFGMGGTNAHVVLEEAPAPEPASADPVDPADPRLLVLSARTPEALDALAAATAAHLESHPDLPFADVVHTLARGRTAFPHRRAVVARDGAEAAALLREGDPTRVTTLEAAEADPGVVFLFSGLGTQYAGMGRGLYETEPVFREAMDRCFAILRERWEMDLAPVLHPTDARASAGDGKIDLRALVRGSGGPSESDPLQGARWGHPAVFSVGYALAELWRSRGVEPRAVAGHSLGEYVAACVAGVFTLEDALTLVVRRAALLDSIPGSMAAVSLSEAETRALIDSLAAEGDAPWLAAVNAPRSCVVSGSAEAVARFADRARAEGALVLPLAVRHPFHSGLLAPAREEFARVVGSIRRRPPRIPLAANATGEWLRPEQAQSVDYWVDHLLNPVRFAECVDTLRGLGGGASGEPVLLEVGPGSVLGSWARQQGAARVAASLRHAEQPGDDGAVLLRAVGQLWAHGVAVDWTRQMNGEGRRRVVLPGHPLQRRRFWLEPASPTQPAVDADERRAPEDWFYTPLWTQTPAVDAPADAFRGRRIVVFGSPSAAPLADRLRSAGAEVVRVEAGTAFRDGEACITLRPGEAGDFALLARTLADRGWAGETHTLHLWSLEDDAGAEVSVHEVRVGLARGMHALLHWVRAAHEAGSLGAGSTLLGATRGAQAVLGIEGLRPWQAAVAPLVAVAAREHGGVRGRAVDVEARGWEDAVLAEAGHLLVGGEGGEQVAYRGRGRWTPFFASVSAETRGDGGRVRLRERGVYLIAGGLRGDGLAIARYLAEHARARLVLTGRRGIPPREGWDAWVAEHGEADSTSRRIRTVRELEALGAEVRVASANVTAPAAMRAVVEDVVAAWGAVHGVVHAIGAASGGWMRDETPDTLSAGQAAAVAGALVLDDATKDIPLDFFVLSSSLHAAHGVAGELGRAAAGAILDAFATSRDGRGRHVVSIAWDAWSEGDSDGITPREGAEAFGRILAHGFAPRVAVSTRDLPARIEAIRRATPSPEAVSGEGRRTAHPRPPGMPPYVEPRTELERDLAAMYRRALGIDPVGADDHFFDLGGDSLLATQLLSALNERFRVQLPLRDLFEAATPARLAVAIVQKQAEQIDDDLLAQVLAEL